MLNFSDHFTAYQSQFDSDFVYDNKNRSIADISNIKRFKVNDEYSKLITDVWIQQKNQALSAESFVGLVAFSKEKNGENALVTRILQSCSVINDKKMQVFYFNFKFAFFSK